MGIRFIGGPCPNVLEVLTCPETEGGDKCSKRKRTEMRVICMGGGVVKKSKWIGHYSEKECYRVHIEGS